MSRPYHIIYPSNGAWCVVINSLCPTRESALKLLTDRRENGTAFQDEGIWPVDSTWPYALETPALLKRQAE